jgi:hypothetical protein
MNPPSVTPLLRKADPTAAARARRYRRRRRAKPLPATAVTVKRHGVTSVTVFVAAMLLATVSAAFSIVGLTAVFTGAFWPVVGMGGALECGKLAAVAWLGRRHYAPPSLRAALVGLVALLIAINAIGCYGFLARAHLDHALAEDAAAAERNADVDARIAVQTAILADIDRGLAQLDGAVEETIRRGRAAAALTLAKTVAPHRAELAAARVREANVLAGLKVEKATAEGSRKRAAADAGPVLYLAELLGANADGILRAFIVLIAALLDPAAVVLLLAATAKGRSP